MAQNVTIAGASYTDVPSIVVPKTGGGTASFTDVSSTTAVAEDVASGKIFYLADGTQGVGTSSGGGGTDYLGEVLDKSITSYENSNLTKFKTDRTFYGISTLQHISFPNVTEAASGSYLFSNCSGLTSISLPKMAFFNGATYVFNGCTALTVVVLPSHYRTFQQHIFSKCTSLHTYDAGPKNRPTGNYNIFGQNFFNGDTALKTIILRPENLICGLGHINAFTNTPFASGGTGGTIYIPKALYDHLGDGTSLDYKAATNWSTVNGYGTITWAKIEGSQYENYYADGTPIT